MAWGIVAARAFAVPLLAAFGLVASLLLVCCAYCIAKGRRSPQREHSSSRRRRTAGFLIVAILEAAGVFGVVFAAQKTARLDALPDWIGLVVGLHFFALARVFRAPIYYATGGGITLWCVLSWVLFYGNPQVIAVGFGIGAILWATSGCNLLSVFARRRRGGGNGDYL